MRLAANLDGGCGDLRRDASDSFYNARHKGGMLQRGALAALVALVKQGEANAALQRAQDVSPSSKPTPVRRRRALGPGAPPPTSVQHEADEVRVLFPLASSQPRCSAAESREEQGMVGDGDGSARAKRGRPVRGKKVETADSGSRGGSDSQGRTRAVSRVVSRGKGKAMEANVLTCAALAGKRRRADSIATATNPSSLGGEGHTEEHKEERKEVGRQGRKGRVAREADAFKADQIGAGHAAAVVGGADVRSTSVDAFAPPSGALLLVSVSACG